MSGYDVALVDRGEEELGRGLAAMSVSLARFRKAEKLTEAQMNEALARVTTTTSLHDAVADADVVLEAVPRSSSSSTMCCAGRCCCACRRDFASNTSQLSITQIASALAMMPRAWSACTSSTRRC